MDKECIQQILGILMKKPQYLTEVDKYNLTLKDFSSRFEGFIFYAIKGLYAEGAEKISPADIDNYLSSSPNAKDIFNKNNGIEYLQDIYEYSNEDNFQYYYNKLKKINLIRDLKKDGFDTRDIYSEEPLTEKQFKINDNFEELNTTDIITTFKKKILNLEDSYAAPEEVKTMFLSDGIREMLEELKETPDIGVPIQGEIYNQVINGAERSALTIRSGCSGLGKTRQAVGDVCYLAYPCRFNWDTCKWEQMGSNEKVLLIITEQTPKQIRKMVLAYLTGINEAKFKICDFNDMEKQVIEQAINVMETFKDNVILIQMPNPTIDLVKSKIRNAFMLYNFSHVFYDYIFIGPSLLKEFKGFNLRDDEVLLMFATALKDLAVELNVSMTTSTQVNAKADDNKNIRNEASLAGGRATINKADNGAIMARPTKEELEILDSVIKTYGVPNMVTDIFKVRSGAWTQVRIWSKVDLGTLRKIDLFITDSQLEPIEDFYSNPSYTISNWEEEEEQKVLQFISDFNNSISKGK